MFSKTKINDPIDAGTGSTGLNSTKPMTPAASKAIPAKAMGSQAPASTPTPSGSTGPSIISPDLKVIGNLLTDGDLQIEGIIEGDVRANLLTIGEQATIKGEVVAEDVVVNGHVIGRIRGSKVRLSSSGRVEGDILHTTIAIEAGAEFEGSVHRSDDPINGPATKPAPAAVKPAAAPKLPTAMPNPAASAKTG